MVKHFAVFWSWNRVARSGKSQGILKFGAYACVCVSAFTEEIIHTCDNHSF